MYTFSFQSIIRQDPKCRSRWWMCCIHRYIWLPKQMCIQAHEDLSSPTISIQAQKWVSEEMCTNTSKEQRRGESHLSAVRGNWGSCVCSTWILTTWDTEQWGKDTEEEERKMEGEARRGGADGSAIWWMEKKQERELDVWEGRGGEWGSWEVLAYEWRNAWVVFL